MEPGSSMPHSQWVFNYTLTLNLMNPTSHTNSNWLPFKIVLTSQPHLALGPPTGLLPVCLIFKILEVLLAFPIIKYITFMVILRRPIQINVKSFLRRQYHFFPIKNLLTEISYSLSNNPYPEPNQSNSSYWYLFLKDPF
jgi:hypothetical protein